MIILIAILRHILILIVTHQHQTAHSMMEDSVADVHIIIIDIALADSFPVHQALCVPTDVGLAVERPIQAVNNMIYFYKGDKLWQHK